MREIVGSDEALKPGAWLVRSLSLSTLHEVASHYRMHRFFDEKRAITRECQSRRAAVGRAT